MKYSLEVYLTEKLIFFSDRKWLHPLLELEKYLCTKNYNRNKLIVKDKIVGRAAALMLVYLGIKRVMAEIMSEPGKAALENHGVSLEYVELVSRIQCRTEEMLKNELDPNNAYNLIKKLALSAKKIKQKRLS